MGRLCSEGVCFYLGEISPLWVKTKLAKPSFDSGEAERKVSEGRRGATGRYAHAVPPLRAHAVMHGFEHTGRGPAAERFVDRLQGRERLGQRALRAANEERGCSHLIVRSALTCPPFQRPRLPRSSWWFCPPRLAILMAPTRLPNSTQRCSGQPRSIP